MRDIHVAVISQTTRGRKAVCKFAHGAGPLVWTTSVTKAEAGTTLDGKTLQKRASHCHLPTLFSGNVSPNWPPCHTCANDWLKTRRGFAHGMGDGGCSSTSLISKQRFIATYPRVLKLVALQLGPEVGTTSARREVPEIEMDAQNRHRVRRTGPEPSLRLCPVLCCLSLCPRKIRFPSIRARLRGI